ncbi:MAG: type VII secretion protein EccCb [Corynebacterium sp.]|nr:type VII secretion protein EccCb [Corynebacterium sp.]
MRLLMPVAMLLLVIGMLFFMLRSGTSPMMALFPLMMVASMLGMTGTSREDLDEQRRAFMRHIDVIRHKAQANAHQQRLHHYHYHPDPDKLWSMLGSRRMWEREADQFPVRIGTGVAGLCTPIEVQDSGATEDLDPVCAVSMRNFMAAHSTVPQMPLVVELKAFDRLNFDGNRAAAMSLVRSMVAQLLFHYGPEAVSFSWDSDEWDWLKWTPHCIDQAQFHVHIGNRPPKGTDCVLSFGPNDEVVTINVDEVISMETTQGHEELGQPDLLSHGQAEILARFLTAYRRPSHSHTSTLATAIDWSPRGKNLLKVPIGVDPSGQAVYLDLKEHAKGGVGPHGLCIGATGSGKSELLRTLVVALAATHSPDVLNFVLVDFKGGATFLGLDGLPHTSAVITNLSDEAHLVDRMQDAINGEMNRRQELLRHAGNFANIGAYTAALESGQLPNGYGPLPALVIILDEFSELLGQHPDFAELFVAVGRLGRSLGIHLLLASQRLEEGKLRGLDSHLSYRIGLKTFSAMESRQVLGVADAYELPAQPGVGFLKTDADSLRRFRADYVSGPVEELSQAAPAPLVRFDGWHSLEFVTNQPITSANTTVVDLIVDGAKREASSQAHKIWLEPLPEILPLRRVLGTESPFLSAPIGWIDRPYLQRQDPFIVDFTGATGHVAICGGPQTGKTTALRAIILAMSATHSTEDIRFYLVGSELEHLTNLPHVAAFATEPERIRAVLNEVLELIKQPEARHTFLVIDGWHNLTEEFCDELAFIATDGLAAKVHLLVSTPRWGSIRINARELITGRIELSISDAHDSLISRQAQMAVPPQPGRGINLDGEQIKIATATHSDNQIIMDIIQARGELHVPVLKELPERCFSTDLAPRRENAIRLGMLAKGLRTAYWEYVENPFLFIFGNRGSGKSTALAHIIAEAEGEIYLIDHKRTHLGTLEDESYYSATADKSSAVIAELVEKLESRLPGADTTAQQLRDRSWWSGPHIFLLIDDLDVLPDFLLGSLAPLIPYARDIGFSIVIARRSGGVARCRYQQVISDIKDQNPSVLLLSTSKDEGNILGIRPEELPSGRGYFGDKNLMLVALPTTRKDNDVSDSN